MFASIHLVYQRIRKLSDAYFQVLKPESLTHVVTPACFWQG